MGIKNLFKNVRVIILVVAILLSLISIAPNPGVEGAAIRSVIQDSPAEVAGLESPGSADSLMLRERIIEFNGQKVSTQNDYYDLAAEIELNETVIIRTVKNNIWNIFSRAEENTYKLETQPILEIIQTNETEEYNITLTKEVNQTINGTTTLVNQTVNETKTRNKTISNVIGIKDLGINVQDAPKANVRKGLDLAGGTRVLLEPERLLTQEEMGITLANMQERLNIYGLSDVVVKEASDLSGNQYILVEIAGATEKEVADLVASQGKFEAKVGITSVFQGGNDVTYVCRSADCSGLDPQRGCRQVDAETWSCGFRFSIALDPAAAQRQADATKDLEIVTSESGQRYLSDKLFLYLDDELVDELFIGEDLRGQASTDISISGSGVGATQYDAQLNAFDNMDRMRAVLITGSLPAKLNVVRTDNISASLGKEFVRDSLIMGMLVILAVSAFVLLRYKNLKIALPMSITMVSEVVLLLGVASLFGQSLELAAIAGIIVAVGTGVDDQIVITDETLRGESKVKNWKARMKRAFFIIMGAYLTTLVAMIPLVFAGAGLVRGFAIITIVGVTIGVFVTRPAYAAVIEHLLSNE